ncbi:MAG: carbohydrate-binding family 9-like protein [Dysgonomonas sp.]|nr:carbohydrate-binding family 9-like protein [Dysgonomonas sp.]
MKSLSYFLFGFLFFGLISCQSEKKTIVISELPKNDSTQTEKHAISKLTVSKIDINAKDIKAVSEKLQELPKHKLSTVNWPDLFPSKPEVYFTIAHNGENILLQYQVTEKEILGQITQDNGRVWTDSAVEFFLAFDDQHYYNAEFNCIGTGLLGYCNSDGTPGEPAPLPIVKSIKREASLGTIPIAKTQGLFDWTITLVIPKTAYWKEKLTSFDGLKAKGNFYKCGDNLSTPHFVSWTRIDTPEPSFHQPAYFGILEFE